MLLSANSIFYPDCIVSFKLVNWWDKMKKQDKKQKFLSITPPASEMHTRNELKSWWKVFKNII